MHTICCSARHALPLPRTPCMPPWHTHPHMSPAMHAPPATHTHPCHAYPLPCKPSATHTHTHPCYACPAMQTPLPCMPSCQTCSPAMHAPSQPCISPPPCMPPPHMPLTMHTHPTPHHACPPPLKRILDACENITLPQLRCGR